MIILMGTRDRGLSGDRRNVYPTKSHRNRQTSHGKGFGAEPQGKVLEIIESLGGIEEDAAKREGL